MRTSALLLAGALPATLAHLHHDKRSAPTPAVLAAAASSTAAGSTSLARDNWEDEAVLSIEEEIVPYSLPVVAAIVSFFHLTRPRRE